MLCFKFKQFKFRNFSIFFYIQIMRREPLCQQNYGNMSQQQSKQSHQQLNFIQKAYDLVNNPKNSQIIHWSKSGFTFIIEDIERFEKELLPLYFRHNRYQSFVRQLNMYDFHKIRNGDYYCDNKSEFRHDEFYCGNVQSIFQIKRKGFQAKNRQKENTKIKKSHKINAKKNLRKRKLNIMKAVDKKPVESVVEASENSFFIEMADERNQNGFHMDKQKRQDILQRILQKVMEYFETKSSTQIMFNKNKLHENIELAQQIKDKWLEQFERISGGEDIRSMKDIYYKVKEQIKMKLSQALVEGQKDGKMLENDRNMENELLHIIEQEDAIIQSIFKTEIRSTLICITSETYLNHGHFNRKIDTLMGL